MAWKVEDKSGNLLVGFRWGGRTFTRSLDTTDTALADLGVAKVEETILRLKRGWLTLPHGADPGTFIASGGTLTAKPAVERLDSTAKPREPLTVKELLQLYRDTLTPGSKEANTIVTEKVHAKHFERILGAKLTFDTISLATVQSYADRRAKEKAERDTIRKELATLRVVTAWAFKRGHIARAASWLIKDITLPKGNEKGEFLTWEQCARKVERSKLKGEAASEVWERLWLDQAQTLECLEWVRTHAKQPFTYPMFAFAAYTGARRSEILRSERDDWDFEAETVSIREKKADTSKRLTRRAVRIHPALAKVMKAWFAVHPGGNWTVANADGSAVGPRMASKYFRSAVANSKWKVLRGYHVFRHSLASNMASAGIDQRVINEVLGHSTEDMERRYRHLLPQKQADAIGSLFATSK